jgi:hypothetical protein
VVAGSGSKIRAESVMRMGRSKAEKEPVGDAGKSGPWRNQTSRLWRYCVGNSLSIPLGAGNRHRPLNFLPFFAKFCSGWASQLA